MTDEELAAEVRKSWMVFAQAVQKAEAAGMQLTLRVPNGLNMYCFTAGGPFPGAELIGPSEKDIRISKTTSL